MLDQLVSKLHFAPTVELTDAEIAAPTIKRSADLTDGLRRAAREFCERAGGSYPSTRAIQNAAIYSLHFLMAEIEEAMAAGVGREAISEIVAETIPIQQGSPFFRRVNAWPRGYPGDFETVEYICNAKNMALPGTFAHACESYFLSSAPACQHRNKIHHQSQLIANACVEKPTAKILVIASGGGQDLKLAWGSLRTSEAQLVLNDIDQDALDLCNSRLKGLKKSPITVVGNAFECFDTFEKQGPFDLIVCGGLMDYVPTGIMKRSIRTMYRRLLAPGGVLFFTNIAHGNPHRSWMEFCANWKLIERDETEVASIARGAGAPEQNIMIQRESTGLALLIEIRKRVL